MPADVVTSVKFQTTACACGALPKKAKRIVREANRRAGRRARAGLMARLLNGVIETSCHVKSRYNCTPVEQNLKESVGNARGALSAALSAPPALPGREDARARAS